MNKTGRILAVCATLEGSGRVVSLSCDAETGRMSAVDSLDGFFRPSSVTVPAK